MKRALLRVFAAIFILIGLTGFAVEMGEFGQGDRQDLVFGITVSVCFMVMGVLMIRAARVNYRLGCALFFGTLLVFFGVSMIGMAVDEAVAGDTEDVAVAFVAAAVFVVSGILLLGSAHRRHVRALAATIKTHSEHKDMRKLGESDTQRVTDAREDSENGNRCHLRVGR